MGIVDTNDEKPQAIASNLLGALKVPEHEDFSDEFISIIAILLALALLYTFWTSKERVTEKPFSDFLASLETVSQVPSAEIREDEGIITYTTYGTQNGMANKFTTRYPAAYEQQIVADLHQHNVDIKVVSPPLILQALSPLLLLIVPIGLFAMLYFFLYRQAQASADRRSVSENRARKCSPTIVPR